MTVEASEVLFSDTDVDILEQIRVPGAATTGDVVIVTDPGGGAPRKLGTTPVGGIIGGPYIPLSQKGAASGVAELDSGGKLPVSRLPALAITDVFPVASQAAMLALTAERGDIAVRSDEAGKMYVLAADPASTLGNWLAINAGVVSGGATRTTTTLTTASVAAGGQGTGSLTLARGTVLWGAQEVNSKSCRIRFYGTSAARDADLARAMTTDAVSGSYPAGTGISVDLVLASNTSYALDCDPKPVLGDPAGAPVQTVYWTVDNLTIDAIVFQIALKHTPFES